MKVTKVIKNVTLKKVDPKIGQFYTWDKTHPTLKNSLWLCGHNRASNVKIGDKGILEYRVNHNSGLWYFVKNKK